MIDEQDGRRYRLDYYHESILTARISRYEYKGYQPPPKGMGVSRSEWNKWKPKAGCICPSTEQANASAEAFTWTNLKEQTVDSLWD